MKTEITKLLQGLPGEDLITAGLKDFPSNRSNLEGLLVSIASNRLRKYNILHCDDEDLPSNPEHQLYELLTLSHTDPYGQYRSYLHRLSKFENALDHRFANRVRIDQ
jgi:hypothetical protein